MGWRAIRCLLGQPSGTHGVDVTDSFDTGVASLACHAVYLANIGGDMASPDAFLRGGATAAGEELGVELAASFEIIG